MRILHRIASTFTPSRFLAAFLLAFLAVCGSVSMRAQQEKYPMQPTAEELTMTSQPQVPGAAAVYLYREEITDDELHMQSHYVRLKVLTEAGKKYADVRLGYVGTEVIPDDPRILSDFGSEVTDVEGRTIHSDGTVVPFTGKPYVRTVAELKGFKTQETVFTLPDVQVGSILEYRYKTRIPDEFVQAPTWSIQQDLFLRKGYFSWNALQAHYITDVWSGKVSEGLAYSKILPSGADVKDREIQTTHSIEPNRIFDLTVTNIPAVPDEDYMPPVRSFSYRVNFYQKYYDSGDQFWKEEGSSWAKKQESFIGSPGKMKDAVATLVAPGDTDTVKLQKIYAAVLAMDNTSFTRQHETREDKAHGLADIRSVQDIWQRKRGSDDELTMLFIALARSAGLKVYDMFVTNRDRNMFSAGWLTMNQLDDDVAIVVLDGKEQFFDPGQKDCPFGQMAWKHTGTTGVRELEGGGTAIATTAEPPYAESTTQRIADLTLNADGTTAGTVQVTWRGAPALEYRQEALRKDEDEVKHSMQRSIEASIPTGLNVEMGALDNFDDYEKPLVANFTVHGTLATVTAKRLILPSQFFEANSKPLFPQPTREVPVYFNHSGRVIDAMRVKLPAGVQVESAPKDDAFALQKLATYHTIPLVQPGVVLMRRSYVLGTAFFTVPEYGDVKTFYDKMAADDQQPVVLLGTNSAAAPAAGAKAAQ